MRRIILILSGAALLLVLAAVLAVGLSLRAHRLTRTRAQAATPALVSGNYRISLEFDGRERSYIVHVPPGAAADRPLPLFVALHGGGGTADRVDDLMKLTPIADREVFLVAFPDGVGHSWNDGRSDGVSKAATEDVDDVGFLKAMVAAIAKELPVDPARVYAAGISNGGFMSGRLACDASDIFAAVGIIAATAPKDLDDACQPSRPVPVIAFNGTDDPLVPYQGGEVHLPLPLHLGRSRGEVVSVDDLKRFWVTRDGCNSSPATAALPDLDPGDGSTVVSESFSGCLAGADVVFYRIDHGGHAWPGGRQYLPERVVGHTNRDIDASDLVWRFFVAHPMPVRP